MKEIRFKVPELNHLPPEKAEAVLRRCLEGEEYAGRLRKIRLVTFVASVASVLILFNVIAWTGIVGDKYWLGAVLGIGILVFFIALMVFAQMWLMARLVRKLVRKEIADA